MAVLEVTLTLPTLHAGQQAIISGLGRYTVLNCGRRFGKTEVLKDKAANDLLDGKQVAFFAPQHKNGDEFFLPLLEMFEPLVTYKNRGSRIMRLYNGGRLDCWSLRKTTAQSVRGRKYHTIVIDECAYIPGLLDLFNKTLRPLLTDYQGQAIFASTPDGLNDFHTLYRYGSDPEKQAEGWRSFTFPTLANTMIPGLEAEVEAARRELPARAFEQEYEAKFILDLGAVFANVEGVSVLSEDRRPSGRGTGRQLVFGIDWGRDVDFTVVSVFDATTQRQVALERFRQISWEQQRARVRQLMLELQPVVVVPEANASGYILEKLQEDVTDSGLSGMTTVLPFTTTQQSKSRIIDALAVSMEQGAFQLLNHEVQKAELAALTMKRLSGGGFAYSAPDGMHDDTVMALALAWHAVSQAGVGATLMRQARAWPQYRSETPRS